MGAVSLSLSLCVCVAVPEDVQRQWDAYEEFSQQLVDAGEFDTIQDSPGVLCCVYIRVGMCSCLVPRSCECVRLFGGEHHTLVCGYSNMRLCACLPVGSVSACMCIVDNAILSSGVHSLHSGGRCRLCR